MSAKQTQSKFSALAKFFFGFVGFFILLAALIFAFLLYLSSGDGFANKTVTTRIESLLKDRLPPDFNIKIDEARFKKNETGLNISAANVSFYNKDMLIFNAPQINLLFDPLSFIKTAGVENPYLQHIEIVGAKLEKLKNDGEFDLAPLGIALQKLRETAFISILFKDLTLDQIKISLEMKRISPQLVTLRASDDKRELATSRINFTNNDKSRVEVTFNELLLSDLAGFMPPKYNKDRADFKIAGQAKFIIDEEHKLTAFQAEIKARDGQFVKLGKNPKTYFLNASSLNLSWVEGREEVTIESLKVNLPPYVGEVKGVASKNKFLITQGLLNILGEANEPTLLMSQMAIKGSFNADNNELNIERAELGGDNFGLNLTGNFVFKGETPSVFLNIETKAMPTWAYIRLWPEVVAPETRIWVKNHLLGGQVEPSILKTAIPVDVLIPDNVPLAPEMLFIQGKITDGVLKPLNDLGRITSPLIDLYVDGKKVKVETTKAILEVNGAKPLDASHILFNIADTWPVTPQGNLSIKAKGDVNSLAVLLKSGTFKDIASITLDPNAQMKGNAQINVDLSMQLRHNLKRSDIKYKAELDLTQFSQKDVVRDLDLEQANIKVIVSATDFSLKGDGKIGGQQANFEYKKAGKSPIVELKATLDEKARARFGLTSGGRINGLTPVKISSNPNEEGSYFIEVDLSQSALNELIPGWIKPANQTAKAKLTATELDNGWQVEDIIIDGRGVQIRGNLEIDEKGEIIKGNFPTYHLNESDKMGVKIERITNGHKVTLNASVIDMRPLLKTLFAASAPVGADKSANKGTLMIDAKVGAAAGNNGEMMRNIALKATRINGEIRTVDASGRLGKGAFKISNILEDKNNWLTVVAGDAGAWLRFFNIYSSLQGGTLRLASAPPKADGSISAGAVEITDFAIKGDEAIGGMVATSEIKDTRKNLSLEERQRILAEKVQERSGQTVTNFVRLKADFSRSANQIITIKDGLIWGVAIGSTMEGSFDFNKNTMNLTGTYVPAYAINNIFAKLPIIGIFLGGNSDEGLIGVNYALSGPIAKPNLVINPLSIIAPGFLRRILDFKGGRDAPMRDPAN